MILDRRWIEVTNLKEEINFYPKNKRQEADKMPRQFTKLLSNWTEFQ